MKQLMLSSKIYTVELLSLETATDDVMQFVVKTAIKTRDMYKSKSAVLGFEINRYIHHNRVTICKRGDKTVGIMLARLEPSVLEYDKKVLFQDLLFCEPGTRAAKYLLDDFIDFGRRNANHIVTCIGKATNIKERSLENLGFKKLETLYRIEV